MLNLKIGYYEYHCENLDPFVLVFYFLFSILKYLKIKFSLISTLISKVDAK